jgi:2-O-methyltransferase
MRITIPNSLYTISHPFRALRYLKYRDIIAYETIARYLPEQPVIVEAGAFNGKNTLEMASFWPNSVIHAFEPVDAARQKLLLRTVPHQDRVRIYPYALGSKAGVFHMHVSGSNTSGGTQSSSLLKPNAHTRAYDNVRFESTTEVRVVRLDEWAKNEKVDLIDFLWLDLQGFELEALKGAGELLANVSAIHAEVSNIQLYEGAPLYPEIRAWMETHGFHPVVEAVFRIGGNVLFVRHPAGHPFARRGLIARPARPPHEA